jgi:gamma-glutamyltranspeptidase
MFIRKLGRLPFKVVAEPAINYAKNGVEIGDFQFYCLKILKRNYDCFPRNAPNIRT